MSRFKEALLDELVAHAQQPATAAIPAARPHPVRNRRLLWTAGLAGVGAAAAVVTTLLIPSGQQAAYAVDKHPDGTVTITFRELGHVVEATKALRAAGVRAQVVWLAMPGTCAKTPGGEHLPDYPAGSDQLPVSYSVGTPPQYPSAGSPDTYLPAITRSSMTINPAGIPHDAVLFIVEFSAPQNPVGFSASLTTAPAPTCWEVFSYTHGGQVTPRHARPSR